MGADANGLAYTFKITVATTWQNIAPLNSREFVAADAAFAYRRYQKEGVHRSYWTGVSKIERPDKGTLKKPLTDFITPLAGRYQTVFLKELVDDRPIDKKVVGTGPMILKDATQGQQASSTRIRITSTARCYWTASSTGSCRTSRPGSQRSVPGSWSTHTSSRVNRRT